jgi:hypothetical protein
VARRSDATGFLPTAIAILPYRQNAVVLGKQAATIHHLFGGRLVLGAAVGGRPDDLETGRPPEMIGHRYSFMPQHADMAVAAVAKGEDEVRERVRAFAEQDCDELILFPASSNPDQVDKLAAAVP